MLWRNRQGSSAWLGVIGHAQETQPFTTRRWNSQVLSVPAVALFSTIAFWNAALSEQSALCSDILYLIEQSKSQFLAIQGDSGSDFGGYDTKFVLNDAWYCVILEDVAKKSYRCTWKYPHLDQRAHKTFQRFVKEMRNCIGHMAEEHRDQPVNHPDFYASYYFQLPNGQASVSLKNKSELMSMYVSIRIDGFTKLQ